MRLIHSPNKERTGQEHCQSDSNKLSSGGRKWRTRAHDETEDDGGLLYSEIHLTLQLKCGKSVVGPSPVTVSWERVP